MKKSTKTLSYIKLRNGSFSYSHTLTENPNDNQHTTYTLDRYEIYYLISGDVVYQVEGQSYNLKPGDLLIINNKEIHRPYFTSDESYERILLFFKPEFCSHYSNEDYSILQYFDRKKPGCFNLVESNLVEAENLVNYFHTIEKYIKENLPQSKTLIELTFIQLLIHINEIIASHKDSFTLKFDYNKKIEQIIFYINDNLYSQLSLNEISKTFYINKYYFSHQFKKITGVSFKEYIINKRVAKAIELLKLSIPPSEVFIQAGFKDYSSFYKAFKKIVGVSPSRYQ